MTTTELPKPSDHEDRLRQARSRAAWELGDPSWANVIIDAYRDPELDARLLREAQRGNR